jgi:hypothetical protein
VTPRIIAAIVVLCCFAASAAAAAEVGDSRMPAPIQIAAAPPAAPPKSADASALTERVIALEKENLVLREDLGKARLDLRTGLSDQAKRQADEMARMQQKVDELNAQLAAEGERQSQRNRNLWIAIGLLALGVVAAN